MASPAVLTKSYVLRSWPENQASHVSVMVPDKAGSEVWLMAFVFAEKPSELDGQEERKTSGVKSEYLGCLLWGAGSHVCHGCRQCLENSGR